jgi:hypothetical protein
VQADLRDLPFAPGSFTTVACVATLHVLEEPSSALAAPWRQMAPAGRMFASMLITDRALGGAYLRVLQRAGEVGPPTSLAELAAAARQAVGDSAAVDRSGSIAWLRAGKAPTLATGPSGRTATRDSRRLHDAECSQWALRQRPAAGWEALPPEETAVLERKLQMTIG